MRVVRSYLTPPSTHHRILTTLTPDPQATVPLKETAFDTIITLIPKMLKDDEAGPSFYIVDDKWEEEHEYDETPF